jgi:hypothetical protein
MPKFVTSESRKMIFLREFGPGKSSHTFDNLLTMMGLSRTRYDNATSGRAISIPLAGSAGILACNERAAFKACKKNHQTI